MSSKTWFKRLKEEIMDMKFEQLPTDRCIFYKQEGTILAVIIVYNRKPKNFLGIEKERSKESKTTKLYQRD